MSWKVGEREIEGLFRVEWGEQCPHPKEQWPDPWPSNSASGMNEGHDSEWVASLF